MSVVSRLAAHISRISPFASLTARAARIMPVATRSPPPSDEPAAKRVKTEAASTRSTSIPPASNPTGPAATPTPAATTPHISTKRSKKMEKLAPTPSFRPLPTPPTQEEVDEIARLLSLPTELPRTYAHEVEYRNKLVLAPMVRSGALPTRLLSLYYGAGLVWTPEIVDKAIIGAQRDVDPDTGVITYHKGQGPIFTCHPVEKPFLIFQIGSSDPDLAVAAARVVAQDVAGIDLNCGCPKPFSTHAGMGAALLSTPDLLLNILRALLTHIPLPISAKIRILPTRAETMRLAARILATGVRNLTVHCRTRDMRPREKAIHERLADVTRLGKERGVSVTCNGDGEGWANWEDIRTATGADSLMIARAAESNPSVFAEVPADPTREVVPLLLSFSKYAGHSWGNTKFLLMQFRPAGSSLSKAEKKGVMEAVARGKSVDEVAEGLRKVIPDVVVSADKGREFMAELERRMKARPEWDAWEVAREERDKAVAAMAAAVAVAPSAPAEEAETQLEPATVETTEEEAACAPAATA